MGPGKAWDPPYRPAWSTFPDYDRETGNDLGWFAGHYMLGPEQVEGTYRRPRGLMAHYRPMITRDQRVIKRFGAVPDTADKTVKLPKVNPVIPRGVAFAEGLDSAVTAVLWSMQWESRGAHMHPPERDATGTTRYPRSPPAGESYSWEQDQGEQFAYFALKLGFDFWTATVLSNFIYMEYAAFRTAMISPHAIGMGFDNVGDARWFLDLEDDEARAVMSQADGHPEPPSYAAGANRYGDWGAGYCLDSDDELEGGQAVGQVAEGYGFEETKSAGPEPVSDREGAGPTLCPLDQSEETGQDSDPQDPAVGDGELGGEGDVTVEEASWSSEGAGQVTAPAGDSLAEDEVDYEE